MCSQIPRILQASVVVLAGVGCSSGLDGPTPSLSGAISPAIMCSQQPSTLLEIKGQHFSPVPTNVPDGARLLLPTFSLERSALLDGSKGDRVKLVYSGDPEQSKALHWLSETHMQVTLDQGRLPAGIYDARVVNPNGQETTAEAALTVVDPPSFAAEAELLLCESRAEQEIVIEGSGFLEIAGVLPTLQVDGHSDALAVSELAECDTVELSDGDAALCSRAQLSVRNQLPVGTYRAKLANPAPAACETDGALQIRVVAGPQLESDPIESLCLRGQTRVLVVRGKGFQEVSGTLPSATVAGKDVSVVALEDCEPETGTQRSCKKLQLELPNGNVAEPQGSTTLSVTNPGPAHCSSSASLQLRELLQKEGQEVKTCVAR